MIKRRQQMTRNAISTSSISLKDVLRERENLNVPLTLSVLDREMRLLPGPPTHLYTGAMRSNVPRSTLNLAANCMTAVFSLINGEHALYPELVERVDELLTHLVPWMTWSLDSFISTPQIFIPIYPPVEGNICANIRTATALCACLIIVPYYFPRLFQTLPSSSHFRSITSLMPRMTLKWILCAELYFHEPEDIIHVTMKGLLSGHCGEKYKKQLIQVLQVLPADRLTSCVPQLISLMPSHHDTAWKSLLLNASVVRIAGSPLSMPASLINAFLFNRSVHWMCQLIRRVQLADKPPKIIPYAKHIVDICFEYLEAIFLTSEPRWIVQAIDGGLLACIFANDEPSKTSDLILEIITVNLVWRTILRSTHRAMKDVKPVSTAAWQKFMAGISNRWGVRNHISAGFNLCGNEKKDAASPFARRRAKGKLGKATGVSAEINGRERKVAGYPEDFSHRDRIYLQVFIGGTLAKEQTLMERKVFEYSQDTPSETVLACLDYTCYPSSISIASFEEFRRVYVDNHDLLEAVAEAENAVSTKGDDEKTKGILLVTLIPWANRPRAAIQWLEFCLLHDVGSFQLLQEPVPMDSYILTR
ncbi:uncharacterized protein EV420DRAFT_1747763 [Desarmillaria tabescens]|uniref:Uncharacterized protein n=1 Tax=Armillaria tabescens TaxID=1929756 RepID=A0AA39N619_ARMTA|nr:uncharacterized protein EV420DRAFT_1747763 [Desarmillaria tabescens]KAK0458778.1 hypothetical protein EV420DRAFT_1747763 [Desarmillaria tabescens]